MPSAGDVVWVVRDYDDFYGAYSSEAKANEVAEMQDAMVEEVALDYMYGLYTGKSHIYEATIDGNGSVLSVTKETCMWEYCSHAPYVARDLTLRVTGEFGNKGAAARHFKKHADEYVKKHLRGNNRLYWQNPGLYYKRRVDDVERYVDGELKRGLQHQHTKNLCLRAAERASDLSSVHLGAPRVRKHLDRLEGIKQRVLDAWHEFVREHPNAPGISSEFAGSTRPPGGWLRRPNPEGT